MKPKKLYRSHSQRVIAGIAGGIGEYANIDPTVIRVIMVVLAFMSFGTFLVIYLVLILVIPEEPSSQATRKKVKNKPSSNTQ